MDKFFDLRDFDPNKKKRVPKRKIQKKPIEVIDTSIAMPTVEDLEKDAWLKEDFSSGKEREYSYPELLKRIYDELNAKKGSTIGEGAHKIQIEPPIVGRDGTRKVVWSNFNSNCRTINRKPQHVLSFALAELGTTGDIGDKGLTIRGRYTSKQFELLLRKYITEYVTCKTCHSPDTSLKKENRIEFKCCNTCGSTSSVSSIKAAFRSQQ